MVGAAQSAWPVGWALAAINGTLALSFLPDAYGWRVSFLIGLVPALFIFSYRGRLHEPATFLNRRSTPRWHAIFSARLLPSTLRGSMLAMGMHGGYWAIATWWPVMLQKERGFSVATASLYFGALVCGSFVGYVVASRLGDQIGRRATLMSCAAGAIILVFACTATDVPDNVLLALSVPLGFCALGMFSLIGSILAELYPTELRGSGLGFCYNIGRGIAGTTPFLVGSSFLNGPISESIGIVASGAFAIVLLAAFLLPETRGRDLATNFAPG
jgi:MFS family permease